MSFEQLMEHAYAIQVKATEAALARKGLNTPKPGEPSRAPRAAEVPGEAAQRQYIVDSFADIPGLFQPFTEMPDPAAFTPMIEDLVRARSKLCTGQDASDPIDGHIVAANEELDRMASSSSSLEDWSGRAAFEFKERFVDPFGSRVRNQFILVSVLKGALEAEQELWMRARSDVDKIAEDALVALDRMDDCSKNEWTMTFTVIASVAAIAAVPLSGGALLPAALAITAVGGASQVVAAAAKDDPPPLQFSGETAEAVVGQVREALRKLVHEIRVQEAKIATAMSNTHSFVDSTRRSFVAPRPALADATPGNVTGPYVMGYAS